MSSRVNGSPLAQAMKELNVNWDLTRARWNDTKSREFEEEFMAQLPGDVAQACFVIGEIDTLLKKVRSDCE